MRDACMVCRGGRVAEHGRAGPGTVQAGRARRPKIGETKVSRWRAGMIVTATGGPCEGMVRLRAGAHRLARTTSHDRCRRNLARGQGYLRDRRRRGEDHERADRQAAAGEEAKALITLEIRRSVILPPEDTDIYVLPDCKEAAGGNAPLSCSPARRSKAAIRRFANWPRPSEPTRKRRGTRSRPSTIGFASEGEVPERPAEGRLGGAAGRHGRLRGDHVAVHRHLPGGRHSRPHGLGARPLLSRVLLEDDKGEGHWFPCQSAGTRQFGGINETRPILQKGDNFRPPKNGKERQRYMAEYLAGKPSPGGGKPQVRFIREPAAM